MNAIIGEGLSRLIKKYHGIECLIEKKQTHQYPANQISTVFHRIEFSKYKES